MTRIDAHAHLWDRSRLHYAWLDGEPTSLRRSFLPDDLAPALEASQIEEFVFVQADCADAEALDEASWLHELRDLGAPVRAVVAQAPLERECLAHLEALAELPLVTGVRRLLQGEEPGFALQPSFVAGVASLERFSFSFDLCIRDHQLGEAAELVRQVPGVRFVLDHLGKPAMRPEAFRGWAAELAALAALPNVTCKLSGLFSEAHPSRRDPVAVYPWLRHALEVFGPDRCLFGSDWPVLTAAGSYASWVDAVEQALDGDAPGLRSVFGETAAQVYPIR
jgi:L-fuconolactonase